LAPRVVDKAERRAHILRAAVRVFARQGYHFTVMDDIALEAGVSKGALYLYFESRDKLLEAAFTEYMAQWDVETKALLENDAPPLDRLRTLILLTLEMVAADPEIARALLDFWVAGLYDERQPHIDFKPYYAWYRTCIRQLLDEAITQGTVRPDLPPQAAAVLVGAIEGLILQWLVDPEAVPIGQIGDQVVDVVCQGLSVNALRP
jgi:AcrR family transcriptional regulator